MEKLKDFRYQGVELKNSLWERQRRKTIETYLAIPNDSLLHIFRKTAGLDAPGESLMGWYGNGASTFGQKLGAFAKLYAVTGDYRLKEKAVFLAEEWGRCAAASAKTIDCNGTYVYEKLLGGFLDMYEFLHYEPALAYISALTDSAARRFKRDIPRDGLQGPELCDNDMIEWYTLPENLYRAYLLTGEKKYLDFAREWDYTYLWDKLNAHDSTIGPRHAYSQVNSFSSAAMAYLATGDKKYLDAAENGYALVTEKHTYATGGYGPAECLFADEKGFLGEMLKDSWDSTKNGAVYRNFGGGMVPRNDNWGSCEVSCCAWAVFKICNYLLRITGKAKYGDWAEQMLINGVAGQPPIDSEGHVMYYAGYFVDGAVKSLEDRRLQPNGANFEWQCCTGTFPQDVAEYANMIYYTDEEGIYVSQYLPSKASFSIRGSRFALENCSGGDISPLRKFRVQAEGGTSCRISFRIPRWAKGVNRILVNGEDMGLSAQPDTWAVLEREWQADDVIEISLPFSLEFKPVDEENPDIAALCFGPVVLAADKMSLLDGDMEHPEEWITCIDEKQMLFRTAPGHVCPYPQAVRTFRPYYKIPVMEWYFMYVRFQQR